MVNSSVIETRMVNIYAGEDPNIAIAAVNSSFSEGKYCNVNVTVIDAERVRENWESVTRDVMAAIDDALSYAATKRLPIEA